MKKIYFYTPTILSYLDLVSMGGSDKAGDEKTIGKYNSGLKFSMALALQNNIEMVIKTYDTEFSDNYERKRETSYFINTYTETCEQTEKEKELIQITKSVVAENFHSGVCNDYGGGEYPEEYLKTGFSTKMGLDWQLWMLLREIFSNMVDEGGRYYEDTEETVKTGTVVRLMFEEGSEFDEIWKNRHLYINEEKPLFKLTDSVDVLKNEEGYLRIYKQNILVYKDEDVPSRYAYNIRFGQIDERRILSDIYDVEGDIASAIMITKNEDFLREIITPNFVVKEKEFLESRSPYRSASDLIHDIAFEVYQECGDVKSYQWLIENVKRRKDCKIGGKKITNVGDSLWSYSNVVSVETTPKEIYSVPLTPSEAFEEDLSFNSKINKYYNFNVDVEVKEAKLKGSKVIADKYNNCLIVDTDFNVETDFPEFIVQYLDLTEKTNVIKALSEYICKLIRK